MDSDSTSTRIEKLNTSKHHAWKIRVQHVLALKDLEEYLVDDPPSQDRTTWGKKDKKAHAIIGITLSDELLENVREVATSKVMWTTIKNVFERHTLLNKLAARRKFYIASMSEDESVLNLTNRIRQMAATLKAMGVVIPNS